MFAFGRIPSDDDDDDDDDDDQWRRYVLKYEDQGPSGQAIKLFPITPYINDFQTFNNPCSWQTADASKN